MSKNKKHLIIMAGILLIILGVFLLIIFMDFNPEDSLYFSKQVKEQKTHFLGKPGVRISSLMFLFLGRGSFILTFVLIYTGFNLLRRVSQVKKILLIFLAFSFIITFSTLLSILISEPLYLGGGLAGKKITEELSVNFKKWLLIFILFSLTGAQTFFLMFRPLKTFITFLKSKFSISKKTESLREGEIIEETGDRVEKTSEENGKYMFKKGQGKPSITTRSGRKRRKPPLIEKVYYNENGMLIETDEIIPFFNKNDQESEPVEDEKGQYLIGEVLDEKAYSCSLRDSHQINSIIVSPNKSFLRKSFSTNRKEREKETARKARELERTLKEFGIEGRVTGIIRGPVITRYELQPAPGIKLSRIVNLSDNIALSLSANGVRIEAPIPGRSAVGIEIPNEKRETVTLGDVIEEADIQGELPLILGRDISGKVVCTDLTIMPHLLIAGATGSGKSVCVNALIVSLLFHKKPEEVRFLMIDPKMVELKIYNGIPHLLTEVITDPRDVSKALRWVIYEMENRYYLLDEYQVRDIKGYNQKARKKMPYIVIIVDEFANLMAISPKDVEDAVVRLAAMSRAVGIHLIMATQRPSVDVITGLIKANFPYRIAFQVASKTDSRTILDSIGAEKLLGRGDMLFSPAGSMNIHRIQGAYISEEEVLSIVKDLKKQSSPKYLEEILYGETEEQIDSLEEDPISDQAIEIVLKTKRASASFLQRRLKIGYNRAARLIEMMEEKGIIGPPRGSKPREIYIDRVD